MKMKNIKNSGFTLIEIIVVLIIVGVLAAIALPSLFSNINKSKGAEAVGSLSTYKTQLEGCGQKFNPVTYATCGASPLGLVGNFYYQLGDQACGSLGTTPTTFGSATGWCISASPGGPDANNWIRIRRPSIGGTIVCSSQGTYSGIC